LSAVVCTCRGLCRESGDFTPVRRNPLPVRQSQRTLVGAVCRRESELAQLAALSGAPTLPRLLDRRELFEPVPGRENSSVLSFFLLRRQPELLSILASRFLISVTCGWNSGSASFQRFTNS